MRLRLRSVYVGISVGLSSLAVGVAHASKIDLYGVLDTGLSYTHVSRDAIGAQPSLSNAQFGMDTGVQSGSRWGIKGSDALGGGWVASFDLESGFSSLNGESSQGGRLFGRRAVIALSQDDFGDMVAGRQTTISTNYFGEIDPLYLSYGQANMGASFGSVNTVRYDSLIQYETPRLAGLQAGIGYSFNTGNSGLYASDGRPVSAPRSDYYGTNANMRALTIAAQYDRGPVGLAVSYDRAFAAHQIPAPTGTGTISNPDGASPTAWIVGATYDFKVVKVAAAFGRTYDGAFSGNGPGNGLSGSGLETETGGAGVLFQSGFDTQSTMVGFTVPLSGPGTQLMFSWQTQTPKGALASRADLATQSIFGMAYTYGLSKRTNLYFWGSYGHNFQMLSTAKSSVVGAGVRHLF